MDAVAPLNSGAVNPSNRQTARRDVWQFSGGDGLEGAARRSATRRDSRRPLKNFYTTENLM